MLRILTSLFSIALVTITLAEDVNELRKSTNVPWPPIPADQVARYTALRTIDKITVDGKLDEQTWQHATRSPRFVDLIRGHKTVHDTHAAVTWDDENLYVAYWVQDPFVSAHITKRDYPVYNDNDVEFFLAFDHAYYEFEINPFGTIYEGLFVWQNEYEKHGFSRVPELDRTREEVKSQDFNGVGYKTHPRGLRYAFLKWDYPEAKTAVAIDGTLNDPSDRDRGWTVELAFPWSGMKAIASGDARSIPPRDGDVWRMDFSRFNQFKEAPPVRDTQGWAWSPHGCWDSHIPEVFPFITFSTTPASTTQEP
jgi:Carbohydrate-binding family 9